MTAKPKVAISAERAATMGRRRSREAATTTRTLAEPVFFGTFGVTTVTDVSGATAASKQKRKLKINRTGTSEKAIGHDGEFGWFVEFLPM